MCKHRVHRITAPVVVPQYDNPYEWQRDVLFAAQLSALIVDVPCPSFSRNASSLFYQNLSSECNTKQDFTLYYLFNIGPLPLPVFIISDLAPLIVYFPVLIVFNINLASGPAQSFLFFYHAVSIFASDILWGFLTMQSPISTQHFPVLCPTLDYSTCNC